MLLQGSENRFTEAIRQYIGSANLKHTWSSCLGKSQHGAEIEVVREHNIVVGRSPFHYFGVAGTRVADPRPVNGRKPMALQQRCPAGGQVHIDHKSQLHERESGISRSSSLHAA